MPSVALLATGDELVNGDILNTNAQIMAQDLLDNHYNPTTHLLVKDDTTDLVAGIRYLWERHDILISIGGLGPTTDDLTRFALAEALNCELIYHEESYERLKNRLLRLSLKVPESNKVQALFFDGANVFPNAHGTADGMGISLGNKTLFMLPGPPKECLSLFNAYVLPWLDRVQTKERLHRHSWTLLGVGESQMAEQLADINTQNLQVGYRAAYPYLEVKLFSTDINKVERVAKLLEPIFSPYLVSLSKEGASDQLLNYFENTSATVTICDKASKGLVMSKLLTPFTQHALSFTEAENDADIVIKGLEAYWNQEDKNNTLFISYQGKRCNVSLPNQGERTRLNALEHIAKAILSLLDITLR